MLLILAPLFPIAWLRLAALVTGTADVGGWYSPTDLLGILQVTFATFAVNRADPPWEAIGAALMAALALLGAIAFSALAAPKRPIKIQIQNPKSDVGPGTVAGPHNGLLADYL
jgi:hypothetical protein